ncbi:MAG TPA: redoxin domain-containing protein [Polyangiaceae bacterium]|nr:redoxin domain-containing protein [Polyangiaceae bacterium]
MAIAIGATAPDFELASNELTPEGKPGKTIRLSTFRGQASVVLAFYPLDFSPTCSGEMACFRDDVEAFRGLGAQVLGLSVDSAWAHAAFAQAHGLAFPLLADFEPKGAVARAYGLYEEARGFAKRATVIVDRQGKVAYVADHGLGTPRQNHDLLEVLKGLG